MRFWLMASVASILFFCGSLAADEPHATLAIGAAAPSFSLPGIDGKTHRLADYAKAKVLIIVFTCNHCPTAQLYEARIKKLADDYRAKNVALVAIQPNNPQAVRLDELGYTDVGDSLDDMKIRAAYRHFDFPYLYDGDTQSVARAYGPKATPHVFIFDGERKLQYEGRIDNSQRENLVKTEDARNAVDALLADRAVAINHTGVFGCSTKWIEKKAGRDEEERNYESQPVTVDLTTAADLKKLRQNGSDKILLVNFWATWCGPCVHEFPEIEATWRMYKQRDFDLVMVSANMPDEKPGVLKMLERQHATGRNLLFGSTETQELQTAFNAKWEAGVPYTVLLAPNGKILYEEQGEVDILKLRRVILANLPDPDYIGHRAYWAASLQ